MMSNQNSTEETWREMPFCRNTLKSGLGLVLLIFCATVLLHFRYTPDDTFIYLQFAKNILRGGGFAFNASEPTYGVTSPLWTLLIAAGGSLKLDTYLVAKLLDLLFASAGLIVFYLLALEVIRERLLAFLATFVFSVNVWFVRWAGTGMETSLSVLLVLATILYCVRKDHLIAAAASSVLMLVRPEAGLLFVLIVVDALINATEKRHGWKLALGSVLLFAVIVGPWLVFAKENFGTVIPNALHAKSGFGITLAGVPTVALDVVKTIATSSVLELFLGLLLIAVMVGKKLYHELQQHIVPLLWVALLILVYVGAEVDVVSRYILLVLPFIILYGFYGLKKILDLMRLGTRYGISIAIVITAVILIQNQYVFQKHVKPHTSRFANGVEECLRPIALWLAENTPPGTVVVAPDVGVIGYWSDRKVCDIAGLITPEMKKLRKEGLTYDEIMIRRLFIPFCYPEYVIDRSVVPERLTDDQFTPLLTRRFEGLGLAKPEVQYYTLYKLTPGIYPRTEITQIESEL